MGAFGGYPQKAQSLRLDVQIETREYYSFPRVNHQLITVSRENVGTLLIPNETFITQTVLNHSLSNRKVRIGLPVQISYGSDLEKAMVLMAVAAKANPRVLDDPQPATYLVRFADSGIDLELGFWIGDPESGQLNVRSELNLAIWRDFRREGIEMPYTRREVRLLSSLENEAKPL